MAIQDDLAFIKKHERYPISRRTLAPSIFLFFIVVFVARYSWMAIIARNNETAFLFILGVFSLSLITYIAVYFRTIRFTKITTGLSAAENQRLLQQFFSAEKLAVTHVEDAPEIFQILSRPIFSNSDQREVMIFIADDKRILVNSHFTDQKFTLIAPSKHYRGMARKLQEHVRNQPAATNQSVIRKN